MIHTKFTLFSGKPLLRKILDIMLILLIVLLASVLILAALFLILSPGTPDPFLDENGKPLAGSISEKVIVRINGVEQGMFIVGKDTNNPVLLYLHGGMPDYFLTQKYPTGLEDYFTVVWWEQRGSGLSYISGAPTGTITSEQLIADTLEVTNYLRNRFNKEKIYLMGHSGGTFIGIQAAERAPELYHAYIGVAQMSNQFESERLAFEFMLEKFMENGNTKMVQKLEAAPITLEAGIPDEYYALRDGAMHSLGIGTTHDMKSIISGIFLPSLTFRGYTLAEKFNLWRGKSQSGVSPIWQEIIATDLSQKVPKLEIPVYFFSGIYDYTCSYTLAKDYLENLQAPIKGFYSFNLSAHSPLFEEPEKMKQIFEEDVFKGLNNLADKE
ncbi:MAG: alpha/beta hydrolase [Anaerolinea sp.]|nr:alpha/beta hydrolase [Anaerolinea sp.]